MSGLADYYKNFAVYYKFQSYFFIVPIYKIGMERQVNGKRGIDRYGKDWKEWIAGIGWKGGFE